MPLKIAMIGAGSIGFTRRLMGDLLAVPEFADTTFAFMDIMPRGDGHCLVVPKAPARNLLDIEPGSLAHVHAAVQKVAAAAMKAFAADGVTVQQFNEPAGGQVVFHYHVHVIPRFDGVKLRPHTGEMGDTEVLKAHAEKIAKALK